MKKISRADREAMAKELATSKAVSLNRILHIFCLSKSSFYYSPKRRDESAIREEMLALAERNKRWEFSKILVIMKERHSEINHKKLYRHDLGLNLRIKPRKRMPKGEAKSLFQPIRKNICWSIDFMSDALISGQRFRSLNIIDDSNRESLAIEINFSISAKQVADYLDKIGLKLGFPEIIRCDNGPEFRAHYLQDWAKERGIELLYIQPGKPSQNAFIERFNRTYREDILDANWFANLDEAKLLTSAWMKVYNQERPHESLANQAPQKFALLRAS